jgi:hypothetical protein
MNVQKLVWEAHTATAQAIGEFRPGEVRNYFGVPFPVAGTPLATKLGAAPISGVLLVSGTALIPAQANMMHVGVDIRVAGAAPGTQPLYSEHFQRFANVGSTHHAFPLKARPISLPVGSYSNPESPVGPDALSGFSPL